MALFAAVLVNAQTTDDNRPVSTDFPYGFISKEDMLKLERMVPESARTAQPKVDKKALARAEGEVDTVEYYMVTQSTKLNYQYAPNGGDIVSYNIGIAREGNKVTFKKFFALYNPVDYSPSTEYDFSGIYDEATKTITVPTPTTFDNAIVVGSIQNYYVGTLACGQLDDRGNLIPDEELVLHVEGDFEKITTDQVVGVTYYMPSGGQSYGLYKSYRRFMACLPKESGELITFNESLDLGRTFPNVDAVTGSVPLINIGKGDVEFVVEVESDPEGVINSPSVGVIPGLSYDYAIFEMAGTEPVGDVEANAVVSFASDTEEGSFVITLTGGIDPMPDYGQIVKNGDFTFSTSVDYPFEVVDFEGVTADKSGGKGAAAISDLFVRFNVPEGKLGKFSFEGYHKNDPSFRYSWAVLSGYFVDSDAAAFSTSTEGPLSGTINLAPGDHFVRFQHQSMYLSGIESNGLYLTSLNLDFEDLPADAAELLTEKLDFGNFIVEEEYGASGTQNILIENKGANVLTLTAITSTNEEFKADVNQVQPATTLTNLIIPITFSTTVAGVKTADITVETSAGTFVVPVKAKVFDMPDFSQVIVEGMEYMEVSTDPNAPFIVENGVAYNANWEDGDLVPSTATLRLDINIPEGKIGYLSWEGHAWGSPLPDDPYDYSYYYKDRASFDFQCDNNMGQLGFYGYDIDAGSEAFKDYGEIWAKFLTFLPISSAWGKNFFSFQYIQNGDSITTDLNRFEVKNIRLHVEDFAEHGVELVTDELVEFEPTYVSEGRTATTQVQLLNTGSAPLSVLSIRPENEDDPFSGIVPEGYQNNVAYGQTMNVTLTFTPLEPSDEEKDYEGNVIITTNAGDVVVPVFAITKAQKGIVYPGDFEDDAFGWVVFDNDRDGDCWKLGWNLWGDRPEYVLSGHECLGSASSSAYYGAYTPDNWAFSPAIPVPADGGKLSFYISAFSPTTYAEHYSFYIVENIQCVYDGSIDEILNNYQPLVEETIDEPADYNASYTKVEGWKQHIVDLDSYAGKDIYLVFRHHDCEGQYVLRLDDVFVMTNEKYESLGISTTSHNRNVASQEFYNVDGMRIAAPVKGVNIVRSMMKDGSVQIQKVIIK